MSNEPIYKEPRCVGRLELVGEWFTFDPSYVQQFAKDEPLPASGVPTSTRLYFWSDGTASWSPAYPHSKVHRTVAYLEDEHRRRVEAARPQVQHFEGTCDVCGGELRYSFDPQTQLGLDVWTDDPDGFWGTWIRHPENRENNPRCVRVFSRVRYVGSAPAPEQQGGEQ